ncbi:MAG TPA: tetratricopeptide repeat protein [Terriglobia bacterium]|nr:tetratricopeptide repeat protein [Terriglobia bacterium]
MPTRLAKKILLIGWDAADWKIATPLMEQGMMPALEALIDRGVMGNLATLQPILSPMVWNSIATGMRPDKHGIHGFMEPDTQTGKVRPVSSTSRKVKAIWNILTQTGFKTHVLGWFAGHPAEPINGISVSDIYPYAVAPIDKEWPLPPGAVHPESLREQLAEFRMHPAEVLGPAIFPFIPNAQKIDQKKDKHLSGFCKTLSENLSIHNAATWILETQPWDFMAVYYNGIDHFCHGFMHFHPPRLEGIPEDMYEMYKDVVNSAYCFHDMLLARLLKLAGPEATIVLCSDHGFHSDHLRPRGIPNEPAGPAVQHRPYGIVCMAGEGIKKDERIYGATLLDITPTLLQLFGLPVGEDMDGRVLLTAFEEPPEIERIPSWEKVEGECGMHPADMRMDPEAAKAVLEQFVALGYIQQEKNQAKAIESAVREAKYNLARVYHYSGRPTQALPLFEELVKETPDQLRFLEHLASCYYSLGRNKDARAIIENLITNPPQPPTQEELQEMYGGPPEAEAAQPAKDARDGAAAEGAAAAPDGIPAKAAIHEEDDQPKTNPAWADWLMGLIHFEEGDVQSALDCLLRAEQFDPHLPGLHLRIGNAYLRMGKTPDAERAFAKALEIDGDSPEAHFGLARVRLRQRRNEDASEQALIAVGLQHFLPQAHFTLGVALARLGHFHRASLAFETSLTLSPGLAAAHRWLAVIYARPGGDHVKATQHRRVFNEILKVRQARRAKLRETAAPLAARTSLVSA